MGSAIRIEMNVPMKMPDGGTLRADVYRPDDKGKERREARGMRREA
jgi:predicted acyl esterase